jgi:TolB-like protein
MSRFFKLIPVAIFALSLTTLCHAGADPFKKIAKDLSREIKHLKEPRVALLAFPYHDDKESSGSSIVSERLTTHMAGIKGVRVVERSLIKKVLEEQHLSETGVIDPSSAQKLGKVLGVNVIVTGTLIDLDDGRTEVNARALKAETGEVMAATRSLIKRSWSDRPHSRRPVVRRMRVEPEPEKVENEAIEIGVPMRGGRPGGYRR